MKNQNKTTSLEFFWRFDIKRPTDEAQFSVNALLYKSVEFVDVVENDSAIALNISLSAISQNGLIFAGHTTTIVISTISFAI